MVLCLYMQTGRQVTRRTENRPLSCLCGLALELMKKPVDRPVYLVFQPGEEIGAGGKDCAEYLKKAGASEVYAFHNLPTAIP